MSIKERVGMVVSDKMEGSCVVLVVGRVIHEKYKKVQTVKTKYVVSDPSSRARTGDIVSFRGTRPTSKTKGWVITKIFKS